MACDHLGPVYRNGDLLYFDQRLGVDDSECIGEDCMVQISEGLAVVRRLQSGSARGKYTLLDPRTDQPMERDVSPMWASPILMRIRAKAASG